MLGAQMGIRDYVQRFQEEIAKVDSSEIERMSEWIHRCFRAGRFVFLCGNGGSGSNASHFCEDLGKGTLAKADFDNDAKPRLKVISLTDHTPYILAWANDEGFERVFAEQLKNLASSDDLLIAISGSGNSANILRAVQWANDHGLQTFGLTGFDGGELRKIAKAGIHVPLSDMGMVESIHLAVFHWVLDDLYRRIST